jgi:uncharacterized membrane protein YphA (DoxX/SURF4 family)
MKRVLFLEILSFLFVLLFVYAALTKLFDYQKFTVQIGQSPLLTGFGNLIAPAVIGTELVIAVMFSFQKLRLLAFFSAFSLMTMFTAYIILMLNFSSFIPCSCGGVLEKLGWTEHVIFNGIFVLLGLAGIVLQAQQLKSSQHAQFHA